MSTPRAQHPNHQKISLWPFKKVSFLFNRLYICSITRSKKTFNLALRHSVKRLARLHLYYVMCSSIFEELCFTGNSKKRRKWKARKSLPSRANPSQKWTLEMERWFKKKDAAARFNNSLTNSTSRGMCIFISWPGCSSCEWWWRARRGGRGGERVNHNGQVRSKGYNLPKG